MEKISHKVFFAQNLADAIYQLENTKDICVLAGCSQKDMSKTFTTIPMPENSIIIRSIDDLKIIDRHERYLDFGSAVTFSQMLTMTQNKLPLFIHDAIISIANPQVRNLATIGGNICCPSRKMTLYAPLLAIDARLEIRKEGETITMPISKFTEIPEKSILTRIRIPLDEWEISVFRRVGPTSYITDQSASFTFLANSQKSILTDMRIAFCGAMCIRNKELENRLIGTRLPLNQKQITTMLESASLVFDSCSKNIMNTSILKDQFLNLLFYSLEQLS